MRITVVGGMNLDLLGVPESRLLPCDSAPGRIAVRPGGVGRNIARRLHVLGAQVSLITALGSDVRAAMLAQFCAEDGIDLSHSVAVGGQAPCYLCVHDGQGDMVYAVNDMAAMDRLTPEAIAPGMAFINGCDGCVLDANLPQATLEYIACSASVPLFLDPVSCVKAPRVRGILASLTAIKPNALEAQALTGESAPDAAAEKLLMAGVKNVCISLGADGVYFANADDRGMIAARPLSSAPLTGAGDALCAGLVLSLLEGKSLRQSAQAGCDAAYDALTRPGPAEALDRPPKI